MAKIPTGSRKDFHGNRIRIRIRDRKIHGRRTDDRTIREKRKEGVTQGNSPSAETPICETSDIHTQPSTHD